MGWSGEAFLRRQHLRRSLKEVKEAPMEIWAKGCSKALRQECIWNVKEQ